MYVLSRMKANPITLSPKNSVKTALEIMQKKNLSYILVADYNKVLGIVAKEDIANRYFCGKEDCQFLEDTKVDSIMNKNFMTVRKYDYLERAIYLLREKDISALPVLDADDTLVGIITRIEIFEAFADTMGLDNAGARLYLMVPDFVGQIAKIANIAKHHNISIDALSVFDSDVKDIKQVVMKVNAMKVDAFIYDLKHADFEVKDVAYL